MDCFLTFMFALAIAFIALAVYGTKLNAQKKADEEENKSGTTDYVYKRNEDSSVIGGTSLDRFFVECVLSGCNDLSLEKNIARAKLLADKYNLSYTDGIKKLYQQAFSAHEKISRKINDDKLAVKRQEEKEEFDSLNRYSEYYGKEKTIAMLTERMQELRRSASSQEKNASMLMKSGQQRERDWAIWGGIANGIAGAGAGVATALDIQAQNAQIRAQNEANMRATIPAYMAVTGNALQNRSNADAIQKRIEALKEKLISDMPASEVIQLLDIINPTVDVSQTGAFKVTATVCAKNKLYIYGDVPAVADGTIIAHVMDKDREIGTAKMVFPVEGVSSKAGIVGVCLKGAEQGKVYTVRFTEYKLWMREK